MKKVSQKTINRTLIYIRILEDVIKSGKEFIISRELAELSSFSEVQVRKDITSFGKAGKPRVGYNCQEVKNKLEDFLKKNMVKVALFGVGNLGSAILKYVGFRKDKIKLVAAFDTDPKKIGKEINGIKIYSMDDVSTVILESKAEIGILAVPAQVGQKVADIIVANRLKGIINFSSVPIVVPPDCFVRDVDIAIEILSLSCELSSELSDA